jgi:hypothetical protein
MNSSDYISILALLTSIIFGYINYRYTKRQFQIAVTPVLASSLSLKKNYNKAKSVIIMSEKDGEKRLYYYLTDLTLRMKNLSNTLAISSIKWKLEYAEKGKWWLPITFWSNAPLIASIPSELDPLEEKIVDLSQWDTLASLMLPNDIEEIKQQDVEGKTHKYFIAKTRITITVRLTLSYKAAIPNAEYVTLRQNYRINSLQSGTLNESGIDWYVSSDDNMIENPGKLY